jgi:hypothetical protein
MLTKVSPAASVLRFGIWMGLFVALACGVPAFADGGGGNGPVFTVKYKGAAINGVVPECEVKVDESQALVGGDTIMTVTVKNVNLPDGTVLKTIIDFDPLGSLVLKGSAGSTVIDLGRFAPGGRDTFDLDNGDTFILGGLL